MEMSGVTLARKKQRALSETEKKILKEAFELFDSNNDGYLDYYEFKASSRCLGFHLKKQELLLILETYARCNKNTISYEDFYEVMEEKMAKRDPLDEIREAFKLIANEKTNAITFRDLKHAAEKVGADIPDRDLRSMIEEFDTKGEGKQSDMSQNLYDWEEEHRKTVRQGTQALLRTAESLERSERLALETSETGNAIISELRTQTESLERAKSNLQHMNDHLTQSQKIIRTLYRRVFTNKFIELCEMLAVRNVVLGVSGGVDSAVAGVLLKQKGFNVIGVFMRNWDLVDENGVCVTDKEFEDAKFVCDKLRIPLQEVNFVKEYWNDVFSSFMQDYESGLTPNPDILCNKYIKFKAFFNHAIDNLKADAIATGHYAKTSFGDYLENYQPDTDVKMYVPDDHFKDQTFFLSQVTQKSLRRTLFPLGSLQKHLVKQIAVENGLGKIAKKKESTGICFIGKRNFSKFMAEYVTPKPGRFINMLTGKVEGTHDGVHLWTLGQRSGLSGSSQCLYVAKKIKNSPDVGVVPGVHHPLLFSSFFYTEEPHWIAEHPDLSGIGEFDFRFQHARSLVKCRAFRLESGKLFVVLTKPLRAITPGQYAVFYKDNECFGSAKINLVGPSEFSLGNHVPDDYVEYNMMKDCAFSA